MATNTQQLKKPGTTLYVALGGLFLNRNDAARFILLSSINPHSGATIFATWGASILLSSETALARPLFLAGAAQLARTLSGSCLTSASEESLTHHMNSEQEDLLRLEENVTAL